MMASNPGGTRERFEDLSNVAVKLAIYISLFGLSGIFLGHHMSELTARSGVGSPFHLVHMQIVPVVLSGAMMSLSGIIIYGYVRRLLLAVNAN